MCFWCPTNTIEMSPSASACAQAKVSPRKVCCHLLSGDKWCLSFGRAARPRGQGGSPSAVSSGGILQWLGGVVLTAWFSPGWVSEGFPCALGADLGFAAALGVVFISWVSLFQVGLGEGRWLKPLRMYRVSLLVGLFTLHVGLVGQDLRVHPCSLGGSMGRHPSGCFLGLAKVQGCFFFWGGWGVKARYLPLPSTLLFVLETDLSLRPFCFLSVLLLSQESLRV